MALPFELTTLPRYALEIIQYLSQQDSYAAYEGDIIDALDISERGYGKAMRRLVTREYVEMQLDGSYALTQQGIEAAEAVEAHNAEAMHDAAPDSAADEEELDESGITVARRLIVVYPRRFGAGQPGYFFLRVDAPDLDGELAPSAIELSFRLSLNWKVDPDQRDVTVPADEASAAVRFTLTPPAPGLAQATVEVFQVTQLDLIEVGIFQVDLNAESTPGQRFETQNFDMVVQTVG